MVQLKFNELKENCNSDLAPARNYSLAYEKTEINEEVIIMTHMPTLIRINIFKFNDQETSY